MQSNLLCGAVCGAVSAQLTKIYCKNKQSQKHLNILYNHMKHVRGHEWQDHYELSIQGLTTILPHGVMSAKQYTETRVTEERSEEHTSELQSH